MKKLLVILIVFFNAAFGYAQNDLKALLWRKFGSLAL